MKILLATDGTKYGAAAAKTVERIKLGSDDVLKIISVVDMAVPLAVDIYGGYLPDTSELEKSARESAARFIEDTKAQLSDTISGTGVTVESDVLFGSPDSRIVETAEEWSADLIILGSHGYNRWERLLLGSVSHSVVHHAPCSVLVVRSQHDETAS